MNITKLIEELSRKQELYGTELDVFATTTVGNGVIALDINELGIECTDKTVYVGCEPLPVVDPALMALCGKLLGELVKAMLDEMEPEKVNEYPLVIEAREKLASYGVELKWVNVYEVTREYGGPEEGGWWWNRYVCIEAIYTNEPEKEQARLAKKHAWRNEGNIYSAVGGTELHVLIQDEEAESETTVRPQYE